MSGQHTFNMCGFLFFSSLCESILQRKSNHSKANKTQGLTVQINWTLVGSSRTRSAITVTWYKVETFRPVKCSSSLTTTEKSCMGKGRIWQEVWNGTKKNNFFFWLVGGWMGGLLQTLHYFHKSLHYFVHMSPSHPFHWYIQITLCVEFLYNTINKHIMLLIDIKKSLLTPKPDMKQQKIGYLRWKCCLRYKQHQNTFYGRINRYLTVYPKALSCYGMKYK